MTADDGANEEEELIAAARRGDETAYAALYRRYVGVIYRLAYGVLLHRQDAEEVVQDTFTYAFRTLDHYDARRSAFKTWLYTIATSRCRNKRRRKRLPTLDLSEMSEWLPGADPTPETQVERHAARAAVVQALGELSPKLREAVVLRYFEGLTYREMAAVIGCAQKTAESRVRLAHEALYRLLSYGDSGLPEGVFGYE